MYVPQYLKKRSDLFEGQSPLAEYFGYQWLAVGLRGGMATLKVFAQGVEIAPAPTWTSIFVPYWQVSYTEPLVVKPYRRQGLRFVASGGDYRIFVSWSGQRNAMLSLLSSLGVDIDMG